MCSFSPITRFFALYLGFFLACTNFYTRSQNEIDEVATTIGTPEEGPEPVEEHYELCDIPYLGWDEPKPVPDTLVRMGPNSKYFILAGENNVPIREVAGFCESIGLQPAEIRHKLELVALEVFLKEFGPKYTTFSLGVTDEAAEGMFVEYDGSPMKFHSFAERQPDNKDNVENCVEVKLHYEFHQLVYNDVDCNQGTTPVCMFKPSDRCFLGSPLSLAHVNEDFELVGSSTVGDYYVKLKQYSWSDAASECAKAGYSLVDFSTGLNDNQMLYDLMRKWIKRNYLFPGIPFWTDAKLVPVDSVIAETASPQYKFESSGKLLNDLSDWPSLVWDSDEPSDASNLGLEECISAILYSPYKSTDDNMFTLSTTNCRIPHYPLCYKEKNMDMINLTMPEVKDSLAGRNTLGPNAGKFCNIDEIKVNLSSSQLSLEELLKLAAVSRHKGIHSDEYRFEWSGKTSWLSDFVEAIFKVAKEACPSSFVPPEFLNVMINLLILYYNAMADNLQVPDEATTKLIQAEASMLTKCAEQVVPLHFDSKGGLPATFEKIPVTPISETIDSREYHGVPMMADVIIDSFWYVYQVTVATCWPHQHGSKTHWLAELHNIFINYFLEAFQERWFSVKVDVDYGVLMGDMDAAAAYYSLKSCAIASFHNSNISELYFPRPVYIKNDNGIHEEVNFKIQESHDEPDQNENVYENGEDYFDEYQY